jgi:hypothetical protein
MFNAVNGLEIAINDLQRAQRFFEAIVQFAWRREPMGDGAVFSYTPGKGVGAHAHHSAWCGLVPEGGAHAANPA